VIILRDEPLKLKRTVTIVAVGLSLPVKPSRREEFIRKVYWELFYAGKKQIVGSVNILEIYQLRLPLICQRGTELKGVFRVVGCAVLREGAKLDQALAILFEASDIL
jgi:hypothetical protein